MCGYAKRNASSYLQRELLAGPDDPTKILEIHGDLRHTQCSDACSLEEWSMPEFEKVVVSTNEIPKCSRCGEIQRPKVLMFDDAFFQFDRVDLYNHAFMEWNRDKRRLLGIEIGAGTTIPSVRLVGQSMTQQVIRINKHESDVSRPQDIAIKASAVDGIDQVMNSL